MSGRGGRDRSRRWSPPQQSPSSSSGRFPDKSRPVNPPSRHLWVGNLSSHVNESLLADQFLRFGDFEGLAYQPGRSYAFVNFRRDEDAIEAFNSLQGTSIAGAALRIEFAKDKMAAATRDDNYLHRRDEQRSKNRTSPFSQRESRMNHGDHGALSLEDSKVGDDTTESPSKVLWIGYPTFLKVDETALRKAFSPFGEIEKIIVFQGRNYAFVHFRNLMSACRAKETLQGKLFGTPRVRICFARSEGGPPSNGRQLSRINSPPNFRSTGRSVSSDDFQLDRNFRNSAEVGLGYLPPEQDYGDPDVMSFRRNEPLRTGGNLAFEQRRFHDMGPESASGDLRGYHNGPGRDGPEFHEFSPPKFPKRTHFPEEPWDLPEDPHLYSEAKKLRTGLPAEHELPEYRFSDSDRGKHSIRPVRSDIPLRDEPEHLGFRRMPDYPVNVNRPFVERNDHQMPPRDSFQSASGRFSTNLFDQQRISPDLPHPSKHQEWKWEGTIAKGGNAICRACCLPVGKVLDIQLPEFLDCTARTGLDMLAKHYYQASATWVVFFVPQSDADMSYYNEFMNYLGEKRRAAVANLDDKNTLFLVPPSDFSEEVLKVPGKLSISGVVLRLEPPTPTVHSLPPIQEGRDGNTVSFHSDMLYPRSEPPSGVAYPPGFSSPNMGKPGFGSSSVQAARFSGYDYQRMPDSADGGYDYEPNHHPAGLQSNPSPHLLKAASGPTTASLAKQSLVNPTNPNYTSGFQRSSQDANFGGPYNSSRASLNKPMVGENKPPTSLSTAFSAFQHDQLAQLASSLLGQQQRHPGSSSASTAGAERLSGFSGQSEIALAQRYAPAQASQAPPGFSGQPQFQQPQFQMQPQPQHQPQQAGSNASTLTAQGAQETETDPQKRLQATLQLAAALLQQIQQGKGT